MTHCAPPINCVDECHENNPDKSVCQNYINYGDVTHGELSLQNINEKLTNRSFWEMYKIFESPRDGHCILHSVLRYLNHCCPDDNFTLSGIIDMLKSETIDNREFYIAAIQGKSFAILYKELLLYVNYRIYKTDFGDMVPIILSNAFKRDIL